MRDVAAAGPEGRGEAIIGTDGGRGQASRPRSRVGVFAPRPRRPSRKLFGALDLGTNNCRLLIARGCIEAASGAAEAGSPAVVGQNGEFQVVDAFSRIVRLGEGLTQTGKLSDAAMERTLAALAACADKLARRGVTQVRSVATEACRQAANGGEFVRRVYRETGLALDVISPAEEARLAVIGCQTLFDHRARRTLVFDIGGGSTEVALVERRNGHGGHPPSFRMTAWISIPWGVVSLAETEAEDAGCPDRRMRAYLRMKARIAVHLQALAASVRGPVHLLGASGTITTLASLHMGLPQYDRRRVDGSLAPADGLIALCHDLAVKSVEERALVPGIGADRAGLIVAGAAILEALVDLGVAPDIRVADRGIREGILRSLIGRAVREAGEARP